MPITTGNAPKALARGTMAKHWMAGAVKHPGALHRALHVKPGTKIPAKKLAQAARSKSPRVRKMAGLAKAFSHADHAHHPPTHG